MSLKKQIQDDLLIAMKVHDDAKVSTLRMLKAAILKFETAGDRKEAKDEDVMTLIAKEAKQRKDSIDSFKAGGRVDMAEKEQKELEILQSYLPAQMSEDELKTLIQEAINQVGATSKAEMGKVMGALMPKVKGKADGSLVNKLVASMLK
jgi:uncharacterized protein YqeY